MSTSLNHLLDLPDELHEPYVPPVTSIPSTPRPPESLRDELEAKTKTVAHMFKHGMEAELSPAEDVEALKQFNNLTRDRPTTITPIPGVILKLSALLTQYDYDVIKDAERMRTYVTNRLLEESHPQMPVT